MTARVESKSLAEIEAEEVRWIWSSRIPAGELTLFAGMGGMGKTTAVIDILARLSRGRPLPDDETERAPMTVGFASLEDHPARTTKPRFMAAGGDPARCRIPDVVDRHGTRALSLPGDIKILREWAETQRVQVLCLDSWTTYAQGDQHKAHEIRKVTGPLSSWAHESGLAIVLIGHLNKGTDRQGVARIQGSSDIVNAVRSCAIVGQEKENDPDSRAMVWGKSNYCKRPSGLTFRLESVGAVAKVAWGDLTEMTAEELTQADSVPPSSGSAREKAEAFLFEALASGPVKSSELEAEANDRGISTRTLARAMKDLGVRSKQEGREWWKSLPESSGVRSPPGTLALWHSEVNASETPVSEHPTSECQDATETREAV